MSITTVSLSSKASRSFRSQRAANSLDIDLAEKLTHTMSIDIDLPGEFDLGLIVGASGSGKTTLAQKMWGKGWQRTLLDLKQTVIDQLPERLSYDECQSLLCGVGLSQVVCWLRPASTLSNGQRARAELALQMAEGNEFTVIDEWTSVVDRTVGKAMSACVSRYAKREGNKVVLLSCHRDVVQWLDPDWIIDCDKQTFVDRRSLRRRSQRKEKLKFDIRRVERSTWSMFSKYHYLSARLPGGIIETFGVFHGDQQIGFQCFANYVPNRKGKLQMMHSNRTVIHPDYVGFGLGMKVINITSVLMAARNFDVRAKFSSAPIHRAMSRSPLWRLDKVTRQVGKVAHGSLDRGTARGSKGFRENVKTYSYRWVGGKYFAKLIDIDSSVTANVNEVA